MRINNSRFCLKMQDSELSNIKRDLWVLYNASLRTVIYKHYDVVGSSFSRQRVSYGIVITRDERTACDQLSSYSLTKLPDDAMKSIFCVYQNIYIITLVYGSV